MKYMPLNPEEAEQWNLALNAPKKKEEKAEEPVPCMAPVMAPAAAPQPQAAPADTKESIDTTDEKLEDLPQHR